MADIYLGLGSNTEPTRYLRMGVKELAREFELRTVSRAYRNQAVGFEGDDFLNAVVCVASDRPVEEIADVLKAIHAKAGRVRGDSAFVSRTLDIDLLLVGDAVIPEWRIPRRDVLEHSFVLRPLAEIAPDLRHPVTGETMAAHWAACDQETHPLTEVPLDLLDSIEPA